MHPRRLVVVAAVLSAVLPCTGVLGQIVQTIEIGKCTVTCAAGTELQKTIWASGDDVTPAYWGRAAGDSVSWSFSLAKEAGDLQLGVRYSYAAEHYRRVGGPEAERRVLQLFVDDREPVEIPVPDTGWWDLFEVRPVALPRLAAGQHTFRIVSPAPNTATNLDCFIFYRGDLERLPGPLRRTQFASASSGRFALRATPGAPLRMPPEKIFKEFERIFDYYADYMGWAPPTPVLIHLIEQRKWDNPGSTAYQNQWGVFFLADVMDREQGNWCHEMTHMFYVAHFPGWFDETSAQTLTVFNWVPALFPAHKQPEDNPYYRDCVTAGRGVLDNPDRLFDDVQPIQHAIRVKYGPDVFRRFFHACVEAEKKGDLDFKPGRNLPKAEIVKYMSRAAGEDMEPLYRRWKGFEAAP